MPVLAKDLRDAIIEAAIEGKLTKRCQKDGNSNEYKTIFNNKKRELINNKIIKKEKSSEPIDENEVPFDIPSNWSWFRFQDICQTLTCGYASTPKYVDESVGYPFISAKNVKPYKFMPNEHKYIEKDLFDSLRKGCHPDKGDILLTRVGAGIGEAAIIDTDMEFAIYVSLTLVKLIDYSLINNKYILYWLNSPLGIKAAVLNTLGLGASQGNLNVNNVRNYLIPLPPIEEQDRIVTKVDELMSKIDEYEKLENELAELKKNFPGDMKDAILQAAMEGKFVGKNWCEDDAPEMYKPLWEVTYWDKKFKGVDKIKQPKVMSYESVLAGDFTKLQCEDGDILLLSTGKFVGYTNSSKIDNKFSEDEIISLPGGGDPSGMKYYCGKFVTADNRICVSRNTGKVLTKYIYYYLQSKKSNIEEQYRGISIKHPNMNEIIELNIPIPSISEQQYIVDKLDKLIPLCEGLNCDQ